MEKFEYEHMSLKDVKQFIADKNFESALELVNQRIEKDLSNKKLQFTKAEILFQTKELERSFKIIDEITEFGSPVDFWVLKAKICEQLLQFQASFDCYDEAIGIQPKSKYTFEQGNMKFKLKEFEEALTYYERALFLNPHNIKFLKAKYQVLQKLSKHKESQNLKNVLAFLEMNFSLQKSIKRYSKLKVINKKLRKEPANLENKSKKIILLVGLKKFSSAIKNIENFEQENPSETKFSGLKKLITRQINVISNQLIDTSKELEKSPENKSLISKKINLLLDLEKFDELKFFLKGIIKKYSNPKNFLLKIKQKFLIEKNFDAQIIILDLLIDLEPDSDIFLKQKIHVLNELGEFKKVLPIIQKFLEKNPDDETLLNSKLYALNSSEQRIETLRVIEKLLEKYPDDEKLLRNKIFVLNNLKQFTKSIPLIEELLEQYPDDAKLENSLIFAFNHCEKFSESLEIIEKLLQKEPENKRWLESKIFALNNVGKFSESLPIIEKFLEKNPDNEKWLKLKISIFNKFERFSESLEIIEKLLQKEPENQYFIYEKNYILTKLGRVTDALKIIEKELEKNPEDELLLKNKIFLFNYEGKSKKALEIIEKLLIKHPNDEKLIKSKIYTLNALHRQADALEDIKKLLIKHPNDVSLLNSKAYALVKNSKFSEATNLIEDVIDTYPNNSFNIASLFARILCEELPKGDNHAFLDSKILKNPNNLVWSLVKCKLYSYEQKYDKSKKIIEESSQFMNMLEFQRELAFCYESTYDIDKAMTLYNLIIEKNPNDEFALFGRGQIYITKREYDLAINDFDKAYSNNNLTRYKLSIAFLLGITGKYDEAMDVLQAFSDRIQEPKVILKLKGIIHRKNQRFESSLQCYEQLLEKNQYDVDGLLGSALVYENTEQYDLAIKQIDKILEHEGFLLSAMKLKISILTKTGNFTDAKKNLEAVIQKKSDSPITIHDDQSFDSVQKSLKSMVEEQVKSHMSSIEDMLSKSKSDTNEIMDLFNLNLKAIFQQSESDILEFKSTLRYNTKNKQIDKELEHEVMKTICAFLNSKGGCLVVGYSDDEKMCWGLEKDYESLGNRKDWDGWQQYVESKIKTLMGTTFSGFVTMRQNIFEDDNKKFEIAKIMVQKSKRGQYI